MDGAVLDLDGGTPGRRRAYHQLDRSQHPYGHDDPGNDAHEASLVSSVLCSTPWSKKAVTGPMDASTHFGGAGISGRPSDYREGARDRLGLPSLCVALVVGRSRRRAAIGERAGQPGQGEGTEKQAEVAQCDVGVAADEQEADDDAAQPRGD